MRELYLTAASQPKALQVVDDLQRAGVPVDRLRLYARAPVADPQRTVPIRPARSEQADLWGGALAGGIVGLALASLPSLALGVALVPWLVAVTGVVGGLAGRQAIAWRRERRGLGALRYLEDALARGEVVMVVELPEVDIVRIEQWVSERHPDVALLGTDPRGTPPFP
jgi:hypothetical protein